MIYVVSFIVVFLVFVGMAVGVLLSNKPIRGSCGGLSCLLCRKKKKCANGQRGAIAQADDGDF